MLDCILEGILDTLKVLPYLFITFIILEIMEHKLTKKIKNYYQKRKNMVH